MPSRRDIGASAHDSASMSRSKVAPASRLTWPLFKDLKLRELAGIATPTHVDIIDSSCGRAVLSPQHHLADPLFLTLGKKFYLAIRAILYPTRDPKALRLALCSNAEENAGDSSSNNKMNSFHRHESSV